MLAMSRRFAPFNGRKGEHRNTIHEKEVAIYYTFWYNKLRRPSKVI
jgi:hypothetical protein